MSTDNRYLKAVTKLNELTQEGQLEWRKDTDTNDITHGTDDVVEIAYYADHGEKRLRLYELKYVDPATNQWDTSTVLEFVSKEGKSEWRFPYTPANHHLLE